MHWRLLWLAVLLMVPVHAFGGGEQPPAKIVLGKVERKIVARTQTVTGQVVYPRIGQLSLEQEGLVARHHLLDGRIFQKGEELLALDTQLLDVDRDVLRARVEEKASSVELKQVEVERQRRLLAGKASTQEEFDRAHFAWLEAKAGLLALKNELKRVEVNLKKSVLTAPADGRILSHTAEVGQWLGKGNGVARFAFVNDVTAEAAIPEEMVRFVQEVKEADVSVPAALVQTRAILHSIVPEGDLRSRTFRVRFRLEPAANLMQNQSVRLEIPSSHPQERVLVPRAAVVSSPMGGKLVYRVVDGKAQPVMVDVAGYYGTRVIVESEALKGIEEVIIDGNERLQPGQSVAVAGLP